MGQWRDFPLPDGSYSDETRPFSQQDVVNYLPTIAERNGTRSPVLHKTAPGMKFFAHIGSGPHRGAHNCEGRRFIVSGRKLYQVGKDGVATDRGTIPGTGRVTMAHNQIANGNQVLIGTVDNSYLWDTTTSTLAATGVALQSVDFLNQRFLGVDQQRRFWRHSALADGASWNDLDVYSSESSPDRIVGLKVLDGQVYVFNERTIEVFVDQPTETQVYQRSVVIQRGCISGDSIVRIAGTLFFVGDDYIPYRLDGYTPVPIGTKPITSDLSGTDPRKLFGFGWEDRGYLVYYITAQNGHTWGYDVTNGRWHRRESYGLDRWRINTLTKFERDWYAGDYASGMMYRLEWGYVYEGCEIMPRKLRTGVLHNSGNRVTLHGFRLDVATGEPASEPNCPEPPSLPTSRFLGTGQLAAGTRASVRPLSYGGTWMESADIEVSPTNSVSLRGVYRFGDEMVALPDGASTMPIRVASINALTAWTDGPTQPTNGSSIKGTVSGGRFFTCGYGSQMHYIESTAAGSFTAGAAFTGGAVGNTVFGLAGNGTQMVGINAYGQFWGSTNNGDTFTVGANPFNLTSPNRFYTDYGAIDSNGTRFLAGGGEASSLAYFTDDFGATVSPCSLPVTRRAADIIEVKHCGNGTWLLAATDAVSPVDDGLYLSTDNGANFVAVDLPVPLYFQTQLHQSIAVDGISGRVVIAGLEHGAGTPRFYYTDDFATWTEISRTGTDVTGIAAIYPGGI